MVYNSWEKSLFFFFSSVNCFYVGPTINIMQTIYTNADTESDNYEDILYPSILSNNNYNEKTTTTSN